MDNESIKYLADLESILSQAKKANNICMCPNCTSKTIGSHVFSRSHILEPISCDSKIYQFEQRPLLYSEEGIFRYNLCGINKAFKFNGFCNKHDNELFVPIEPKCGYVDWQVPLNQYLLSYRTVCRELYVNMVMYDVLAHVIRFVETDIPYYKENIILQLAKVSASKATLKYYKQFLEKGIFESDYTELKFKYCELPFQIDLCVAAPIHVNDGRGPCFKYNYQEVNIVNIFPYYGKTIVFIGYSDKFDNKWLETIMPKFVSLSPQIVSSAFVDILYRIEFHAMSAKLYDSLKNDKLEAFLSTWSNEVDNCSEYIDEVSDFLYSPLYKIMTGNEQLCKIKYNS